MFFIRNVFGLSTIQMKISIKDLKRKGAEDQIINFFKKNNPLKPIFGIYINILYINNIMEFYCIDWFIRKFKYQKIKNLILLYKKDKWYKYIYTFNNGYLEKYYYDSKGRWVLWNYDDKYNLIYYCNSKNNKK